MMKEKLQLENECLLKYSKAQMIQKYIDELEENKQLHSIINELEKELDLNLPFKVVGVRHLKNKLQELKGSDKE